MKRVMIVGLGACVSLLLGCEADFEPGYRIDKLRLLAVRADAPFAAPGETVTLRTLVEDPERRSLTWAWGTCTNPPASTVAECAGSLDEGSLVFDGTDEFAFEVDQDALDGVLPALRDAAMVGVFVAVCPGTIMAGDTDGFPVRCLDPSGRTLGLGQFEIGMKRIFVRERDRNENPSVTEVRFDDRPWPEDLVPEVEACETESNDPSKCDARTKHEITVVAPGASEVGVDEFGTPFEEQVVVQFYATEGIFDPEVRTLEVPRTEFMARSAAAGSTITLYFVVRDERGGVGWARRTLRVR